MEASTKMTDSSTSLQKFLATLQRPEGALPLSAQLTLLDTHIDSLQHGLETLIRDNGERIQGVAQRAVDLEDKVDHLRSKVVKLEVEAEDDQVPSLSSFKAAQANYDANLLLLSLLTALHTAHASLDELEASLATPIDAQLMTKLAAVEAACFAFEQPQLACAKGRATAELNRRRAAVEENVTLTLKAAWKQAVRVELGEEIEVHIARQLIVSPSASSPTSFSDLLQALKALELLPVLLVQLAKRLSSASEALLAPKASWTMSTAAEHWQATASGDTDGASALVSLLDWLIPAFSPGPYELSFALGKPMLPLLLPQLVPHLRSTLPLNISSPPAAPFASAQRAQALRKAIQPLLPPPSAESEDLIEEADALTRFAERLGKEWGKALAQAARQEARTLIMGGAVDGDRDEWEPETIEIDVEIELEGLTPATAETQSQVQADTDAEEDEWSWGGAAALEEERTNQAALSASRISARSSSPAGSNGSAAAAAPVAPRRKGRTALGGVRVVKPADQLGSGPLPEEGADDAWGFDDDADLLVPAAPVKPSTSRVPVVEEPVDDAWFDDSEVLAAVSPTPGEQAQATLDSTAKPSPTAAYDPLADTMDEEDDVDEDAWGLTDEERIERAAKRASMRGLPKDFQLASSLGATPAVQAHNLLATKTVLVGLDEDAAGEADDPWETDAHAFVSAAPTSESSAPTAPTQMPHVEVEDVDWDLNNVSPIGMPETKPRPSVSVSAPAPAPTSSTLSAATAAPQAASPIALVESVDEEADGAWGLEEDDEALFAAGAAADETPHVAVPSAPLTEPAVAALNTSSDSSLAPAETLRPSSVISGAASTVVLPPTPATEREDPVEDETALNFAADATAVIEQAIPPPIDGSAFTLTRSSTFESNALLPGTPADERSALEETQLNEEEARASLVASSLAVQTPAARATSSIGIFASVNEEADGAWGLEEDEDAMLAPEFSKEPGLSNETLAPAVAEEEVPVATGSAPLTESAVAALVLASDETVSPPSAASTTGSAEVLPPTPATDREDSAVDESLTIVETTPHVEAVVPPLIGGSALPLLRGSMGAPSIASAPGSDAAVPGTPISERSPIAETEPATWQSLNDQLEDRPSTPLVAPPIGGSALPTTPTPTSTRPPSIASVSDSDAAVPGTPALERAPIAEAAPFTWQDLHEAPQDRPSTPLVAPAIGGSAQPTARSATSTRPASISSAAASDDALPPTTLVAEREEPVFDEHPSRIDTPDIPPPPAELAQALERAQTHEEGLRDSVVELDGASEKAKAMPSVSDAYADVLADQVQPEDEDQDEWSAWAEEAEASAPIVVVAPKAVPQTTRSVAARSSSPLAGTRPARVSSPLVGAARGTASPQLRQATLRSAVAAEQSGIARNPSITRSAKTSSSRSSSPARAVQPALESSKPAAPRKETCVISTRSRRLIALAKRVLSEAIALSQASSSTSALERASWPSARTLAQSVGEILDLHRALVPAVHARALQAPSLAAQFANDCAFVARETAGLHSTYLASPLSHVEGDGEVLDLQASARATAALGRRIFDEQLELQAGALDAALDDARGFDRTHEPEREKAVGRAVAQTIALLRQLSSAWAPVLPASARLAALGSLVEGVLVRVLKDVAALEDISEKESERLAEIVKSLGPLEDLFVDPASGQTAVALFVPSWFKASYLSEILLGSLVDIEFLWAEAGALVDYTSAELASLIRALFAETPNRAKLLDRIGSGA